MGASQESSQVAPLSDQAKDFAKQLVTYADAITAFAVVQLLSFIYLLARGDCFAVNVLNHLCLPIVGSIIVSGVYGALLILCHVGESRILKGSRDPKVARPATRAWIARYVIISLALVATVVVLRQVKHAMKSGDFLTDCKNSKTEGLNPPLLLALLHESSRMTRPQVGPSFAFFAKGGIPRTSTPWDFYSLTISNRSLRTGRSNIREEDPKQNLDPFTLGIPTLCEGRTAWAKRCV